MDARLVLRRRRSATSLVALVLLGLLASAAQAVPRYPDLETLPPRDIRFDRTDVSADGSGAIHNVLRFSNTVWNSGEGRLEMRGTIDSRTQQGGAIQRVYEDNGAFSEFPTGLFYYHDVHQHYHYDDWGNYQLWPKATYDEWVASGRTAGHPLEVGKKTTSCVMDEEFIRTLVGTPFPSVYPAAGCQPNSQGQLLEGISAGWGDTYDHYRYEQWIDLDQGSLPDGQYVLRSVTDPLNKVYESPDKADPEREGVRDNEAITVFRVQAGKIQDSDPPTGTVTVNHVEPRTSSAKVTVRVIGRDDVSGVDQFRLSNDGQRWATFPYTSSGSTPTSQTWDLTDPAYGGTAEDGTRTVHAQFRDASGRWSATETDTIVLDRNLSRYAVGVLGDSPAAYWRLGETSGTSAADATGANPGSYRNAPRLGGPGLVPSDQANPSLGLDGANDHMLVADSPSLRMTGAVSLEAWIKPDAIPAVGSFATIASKREAYALQFNGPRLEFTVMQSGARRRTQAPAGAIATGQTYHVVGTYDGTTARLYVDGAQVASLALTGPVGATANPLVVGSWDGASEFLRGTVDEVAAYPAALPASRVKAHYDTGIGAAVTGVAAPSSLAAIPASSSRIDLQWNDNADNETSYAVERSTNSSFTTVQSFALPADATRFADTGLAPGTTYHYRVRARNATDVSPYSNSAQGTTLGLPSGYAGAVQTDAPVSYWRLAETSGSTAADERGVNPAGYVNGPGLGAPSLVPSDSANPAVALDGLDDHAAAPHSASLTLGAALTLEAWVKPDALPAPGGFAGIVSKPGSYELQLNGSRLELTIVQGGARRSLQAPDGAIVAGRAHHVAGTYDGAAMRVYVNGAEVASAPLTGAAAATTTGLFIGSWNGLSAPLDGTVDDVAVYGSALSGSRVATHFQVGGGETAAPVAAPSGLTATAASGTQVNLGWTDNSTDETEFVVERDTTSSFSSPTAISRPADSTSFSDTGLTPGVTYHYRVKARNASSASGWSNTASASTPSPPVAAPSGLSATAASSSRVDLSWTDNADNETGFVVERATSSSFASVTSFTVAADATSYADTSVAGGTTYHYRVRARNATQTSGYSNTASATTPYPPVAAPSALSATAASPTRVDLRWTDNANNETGFVVERSASTAFSSPTTFTVGANVTTYADTSVAASTTYHYRVRARNANTTSADSNTASVTTPAPPTGYAAAVSADGPVAHWRLGETSGTTAADAVGAHPGAYFNSPTLGTPSLVASDTANRSATFDGAVDHVRVDDATPLRLANVFSLEAWIRPAALPANGSFASVLTKANAYSLQFNGPRLEFAVIQNGARRRLQAAAGAVATGSTYHVVATFDGATRRLFLNGTQVATDTLSGGANSNANPVMLASWDGRTEFFRGTLDEAAVYRTALSAARVSAHWTAGR